MWRIFHVKRYDEKILGKLLDKYERSLLYSGKNQINRTIFITIQKSILPEYFDESAMQYDIIHEQLEQLEDKGYIHLFWKNKKRGHILEKCELVIERSDDAYRLLNRKPRSTKEQEVFKICQIYQGKAATLDKFLNWVKARVDSNESIRKYVDIDMPKEFERLCELIYRILGNETDCFLRQFSIKHFCDSKIAEKDIEKAAHVILDFSTEDRIYNLQTEEILEEYNIYKNPSWIMIKGSAVFIKRHDDKENEINLHAFPGGIGLENRDIESIYWNSENKIEKIVTIENLTSFHQWKISEKQTMLCIYLGGYHNQVKRKFLQEIYRVYPKAEYYHFGDIDCGGFRIWKNLCVKTEIPFKTIYMDLEVYNKYLKWGRPLTEQDRKNLRNMMEDSFFANQRELFQNILDKGIKLEQECIEL